MACKLEESNALLRCTTSLNPSTKEFTPQKRIESKLNVYASDFIPSKKYKRGELSSYTRDLSRESDTALEKSVIYTPLTLYVTLNLNVNELYDEFTHHLLTREQLQMFGFPEEVPGRPGRAVMRTQNLGRGSTERRCCRCRGPFNILPSGQYISDTFCQYHTKKFKKSPRNPYRGYYPCCMGNYTSQGCKTWQYHVTAEAALHDIEFVKTESKKHLNEITARNVYALDCEMVYTTFGMEVVKVGLVGVDGLTVFESFVLTQNQILDYNTEYSGVSEEDLKGVSTTLGDVQSYLLELMDKESILVGHGLENDLKVLRLIHYNIVDTSVSFPRETSPYKQSLKSIAQHVLGKEIQLSSEGHNCIEDARTCMELMLHKIASDLESKKSLIEEENQNSILQNFILATDFLIEYPADWTYGNNSTFCNNSGYPTDYIMPENYNDCFTLK